MGILAYFTEFMSLWAPLSWGVLFFIVLLIGMSISNKRLDYKIKKHQVNSQKESYIEFTYSNGIVPIKTQNASIVDVCICRNGNLRIFILFEDSLDYSSINIVPNCNWLKINFHNKYAIIETWDIKDRNYKIIFI